MSEFLQWPVVMTVAGSDSGGGAGIQADLKAFACCHTFGTSALTAVTAQNPAGVTGIEAVSSDMVGRQMEAIFEAFSVGAVKTGMLFSAPIIDAVVAQLKGRSLPVVVDPVMVATSGAVLLQDDAVRAMTDSLLPIATVMTPNLPEAEIMLGEKIARGEDALLDAACKLNRRFGLGVFLKGGHLEEGDSAVDFLVSEDGCWSFSAPWVKSPTSHGTGCFFSAVLAAYLARGENLLEAGRLAKAFVFGALRNYIHLGEGAFALMPETELPIRQIECQEI